MSAATTSDQPTILHVVPGLGPEHGTMALVDQMLARPAGLSPHLVVVDDDVDAMTAAALPSAIPCEFLGRVEGSHSPAPAMRLNGLIARLRPNVVVVHQAALMRLLAVRPQRTLLHLHHAREQLDPREDRFDGHIASSPEAAAQIRRVYPATEPVLVPETFNVSAYVPRRSGLPGDVFRLLLAGGLDASGGHELVLRAVAAHAEAHPARMIAVTIVGDGPQRGILTELVGTLKIAVRVRFLGDQPATWMHENLRYHDLLVLPARETVSTQCVIEAALARVPALVSAFPAHLEAIEHGAAGWSFEPGSQTACTDAIWRVLETWRAGQAAAIIEKAYRRSRTRNDASLVMSQLASLYGFARSAETPAPAFAVGQGAASCAYS